jgi:hypothetical protein
MASSALLAEQCLPALYQLSSAGLPGYFGNSAFSELLMYDKIGEFERMGHSKNNTVL